MKLLALDTSTDLCSVALWLDGAVSVREALAPRQHGELILTMVEELLAGAGLGLGALHAIAFGRGPGAFTGVRLATATAQGLGFAAGLPLIAVSDLRALAQQLLALVHPLAAPVGRALICQDARMGEVYWGCFERPQGAMPLVAVGAEQVGAPEAVRLPHTWELEGQMAPAGIELAAGGSGFEAYPVLRTRVGVQPQLAALRPDLYPRATQIAELAAEDGLAAAVPADQALPVYLRDRVTDVAPAAPI